MASAQNSSSSCWKSNYENSSKLEKILEIVNTNSHLLGFGDYEPVTKQSLRPDKITTQTVHRIILVLLAYFFSDVFNVKKYWAPCSTKLKNVEIPFNMPAKFGPATYDGNLENFYGAILPFFSAKDLDFCFSVIAMPHCVFKETIKAFYHLLGTGEAHLKQKQHSMKLESKFSRAAKEYELKQDKIRALKTKINDYENKGKKMQDSFQVLNQKREATQSKKSAVLIDVKDAETRVNRLDSKIEAGMVKIKAFTEKAALEGISLKPTTTTGAQNKELHFLEYEKMKADKVRQEYEKSIINTQEKVRTATNKNCASKSALSKLEILEHALANTLDEFVLVSSLTGVEYIPSPNSSTD